MKERFIAKPVVIRADDYTGQKSEHCPKCDCYIERYNSRIPWKEIKFCCYCGQAVKWND